MAQPGKIDRVYEEIIKMEDRFNQLESNQRVHFEQYIEKASASIIAELKRQISQLTEKIDDTNLRNQKNGIIPINTKDLTKDSLEKILDTRKKILRKNLNQGMTQKWKTKKLIAR